MTTSTALVVQAPSTATALGTAKLSESINRTADLQETTAGTGNIAANTALVVQVPGPTFVPGTTMPSE